MPQLQGLQGGQETCWDSWGLLQCCSFLSHTHPLHILTLTAALKDKGKEPSVEACRRGLLWLKQPLQSGFPCPPCAQSCGYVSVPFVFRTLLCPSLEMEGMATAAKPLSQTVACSIGEPLSGTRSWGCAVKFQEKPEKERRRIMDGVWSRAEITTSSHLSSHSELGRKSGLNVAVIDRSPGHRELVEVLFWGRPVMTMVL